MKTQSLCILALLVLSAIGCVHAGTRSEISLFNNGTWMLDTNGDLKWDTNVSYGTTGDVPIMGDWDGDGIPDYGVWRPSVGRFYLRYSNGTVYNTNTFNFLPGQNNIPFVRTNVTADAVTPLGAGQVTDVIVATEIIGMISLVILFIALNERILPSLIAAIFAAMLSAVLGYQFLFGLVVTGANITIQDAGAGWFFFGIAVITGFIQAVVLIDSYMKGREV